MSVLTIRILKWVLGFIILGLAVLTFWMSSKYLGQYFGGGLAVFFSFTLVFCNVLFPEVILRTRKTWFQMLGLAILVLSAATSVLSARSSLGEAQFKKAGAAQEIKRQEVLGERAKLEALIKDIEGQLSGLDKDGAELLKQYQDKQQACKDAWKKPSSLAWCLKQAESAYLGRLKEAGITGKKSERAGEIARLQKEVAAMEIPPSAPESVELNEFLLFLGVVPEVLLLALSLVWGNLDGLVLRKQAKEVLSSPDSAVKPIEPKVTVTELVELLREVDGVDWVRLDGSINLTRLAKIVGMDSKTLKSRLVTFSKTVSGRSLVHVRDTKVYVGGSPSSNVVSLRGYRDGSGQFK